MLRPRRSPFRVLEEWSREEFEDSTIDDDSSEPVRKEVIHRAIAEIKASLGRKRKVRVRLFRNVAFYFFSISEVIEKRPEIQRTVFELLADFRELIVETMKLCISLNHPTSRVNEIYQVVYDFGAYLEAIAAAIYTYCTTNDELFGDTIVNILDSIIELCGSQTESDTWLHTAMIKPMIYTILNAFFDEDHIEFRTKWSMLVVKPMKKIAEAAFQCGDFYCQNFLITVFNQWAVWVPKSVAVSVVNSIFPYLDNSVRKEFLDTSDENNSVEMRVRAFLNAFNISPHGPGCVIPIPFLYLFVCDTEIKPADVTNSGTEYWVDFSIRSGRIHCFYTSPEGYPLSLNLRQDEIDSVCLNWVVNDGKSQNHDTFETQSSASLIEKDERVLFFHIFLKNDLGSIITDVPQLKGKRCRTIYFVFRNSLLVEKIMKEMDYQQHVCGTKECDRPRALRQLLSQQNKLSYSQTWCPDSQVFGLDESPTGRTSRQRRHQLPATSSPIHNTRHIQYNYRSPAVSAIGSPPGTILNITRDVFDLTNASEAVTKTNDDSYSTNMSEDSPIIGIRATPSPMTPVSQIHGKPNGYVDANVSEAVNNDDFEMTDVSEAIRSPPATVLNISNNDLDLTNMSEDSPIIGIRASPSPLPMTPMPQIHGKPTCYADANVSEAVTNDDFDITDVSEAIHSHPATVLNIATNDDLDFSEVSPIIGIRARPSPMTPMPQIHGKPTCYADSNVSVAVTNDDFDITDVSEAIRRPPAKVLKINNNDFDLTNMSEVSPIIRIRATPSPVPQIRGKTTCYADAFKKRTEQLQQKKDFDHYDIEQCSDDD